jgi:hypothetical protein
VNRVASLGLAAPTDEQGASPRWQAYPTKDATMGNCPTVDNGHTTGNS